MGDLPLSPGRPASQTPLPGHLQPQRHWGPWGRPGPGVKKARPVMGGKGRKGSKRAAPESCRAPGMVGPLSTRWGARLEEVQARSQTFLAFDLGHPCPRLEPAAPAHPESPLPTRLLRARGARGTGPGAPRVGRGAWTCRGSCRVPSRVLGWRGGVGGEMKERRDRGNREKLSAERRERKTERHQYRE